MGLVMVSAQQVENALRGQEERIIQVVRETYLAHEAGQSVVPHSVFLRFPEAPENRIIALPAYLSGPRPTIGIKWIASWPGNLALGLPRASGLVVLNSSETGTPYAIVEGGVINAKRTAASAVLAARALRNRCRGALEQIALIGCGRINGELLRFLRSELTTQVEIRLWDTVAERMHSFRNAAEEEGIPGRFHAASGLLGAVRNSDLVAFATTAQEPHVNDPGLFLPGSVVLHLSLRDLGVAVVRAVSNIVDDPDHCFRQRTSLHLAEMSLGNRKFLRGTLASVLKGSTLPREAPEEVVAFSPFGLGVLDISLAAMTVELAVAASEQTSLVDFFGISSGGQV